jgi:uncharacterized repeat protein (TIGR01451 family)
MRHLVSGKVIGSFLVVCALVGTAALGLGRDGLPLASAEEDVVALDEADNGSTVDLRGDQELVIDLEGNLSTGYLWEVASVNDIFLRQVGQFEFEHYSDGVGSVGRQTLRFRAAGEGRTDLVLAYRRSWENAAPLRTFSVSVQTAGPITTIDDVYTGVVPPSPSRDAGPISSAAVPATYEWCSGGGCTPVKDQGICGSCWAFATSGVVESLIKISDGVTRDLSEQYLVSCNIDGWGCDGGSKAFDYFIDTYAPAELAAGAVYESNYPYTSGSTGSTGTCTGSPHTKYEKLISWHSVDGGEYPSVAAIKQAIYDYGPVYVSVCAGPAFQDYSGGIFSTDESATCSPYPTNHGVVLVGWNDSQGVWYLRNSWGTSWGETLAGAGGYMRIAYGTSNVGRSPAYAVYQPSSNVSITKDVVGSDFAPGDSITFTLSVQNSGTLTATTPIVTDTIPVEVLTPTFSSTLAVTPTGVISYVWEVEPLTPGQSGVITVCGWIDSGLESDFSFTNEATISDPDDVTPGNNTSSATVGERYVYLPLVMRSSSGSGGGGVVNGNFEQGTTGWTEYSTHWLHVIVNTLPVSAHSGSWATWLGGAHDETSYIQQQVTVPSSQHYLAYYHWINSEDICGYDLGGVIINGTTVVDVYDLCSDENTGGWVKHVVNLGAYAGQSVSLQIRIETDSSLVSHLLVDDVSFQASAAGVSSSSPAPIGPAFDMQRWDRIALESEETKLADFLFRTGIEKP